MQILRLLDNEAIEPEDVSESKDMVEDYLQRNQDDFEDFADPDDLYTDLVDQLDNLEVDSSHLFLCLTQLLLSILTSLQSMLKTPRCGTWNPSMCNDIDNRVSRPYSELAHDSGQDLAPSVLTSIVKHIVVAQVDLILTMLLDRFLIWLGVFFANIKLQIH